jgi:hypothetical protein
MSHFPAITVTAASVTDEIIVSGRRLAHFSRRRKTVTAVFTPPISGAIMLHTPTKPETTVTLQSYETPRVRQRS